jgi:hypothetical protein
MEPNKQLEKLIEGLRKNYEYIFNTDEGKEVLVVLFIKSMLRKDKGK